VTFQNHTILVGYGGKKRVAEVPGTSLDLLKSRSGKISEFCHTLPPSTRDQKRTEGKKKGRKKGISGRGVLGLFHEGTELEISTCSLKGGKREEQINPVQVLTTNRDSSRTNAAAAIPHYCAAITIQKAQTEE